MLCETNILVGRAVTHQIYRGVSYLHRNSPKKKERGKNLVEAQAPTLRITRLTTPSNDRYLDEISPETSARICSHMNEDHAATCHALVLSTLSWTEKKSKVQNARMTSVTMVGYNLSYVLCNGDACSMKNVMIPFIPSLNSSSQVRARLIDDHHRALNPKFSWLVTDPIIGILFGVSILLGVAMALGREELTIIVDRTSFIKHMFGSSSRFAGVVISSICFFFVRGSHSRGFYTSLFMQNCVKIKDRSNNKMVCDQSNGGVPNNVQSSRACSYRQSCSVEDKRKVNQTDPRAFSFLDLCSLFVLRGVFTQPRTT